VEPLVSANAPAAGRVSQIAARATRVQVRFRAGLKCSSSVTSKLIVFSLLCAVAVLGAVRSRATAAGIPVARVFVVVGENTSASQITPAHAPYLSGVLKPRSAWITSYHSLARSSSLGDYIAMTSGQFTRCEANNALPDHCHQRVDNVFEQLQRVGRPELDRVSRSP
jgi:hypothetical protein